MESSLKEIKDMLEADEGGEQALQEAGGPAARAVHQAAQAQAQALAEIRRDLEKYVEVHEKASFTNTELHRAMNLHISNLRLLGGPLESLKEALPRPQLSEGESLRGSITLLFGGSPPPSRRVSAARACAQRKWLDCSVSSESWERCRR